MGVDGRRSTLAILLEQRDREPERDEVSLKAEAREFQGHYIPQLVGQLAHDPDHVF